MCKVSVQNKITMVFEKFAVIAVMAFIAVVMAWPYFVDAVNYIDSKVRMPAAGTPSISVTETPMHTSTVAPAPTATGTPAVLDGLQNIDGSLYFYSEGDISCGWIDVETKKYYFGDDGKAVSGWQIIEEKEYYFSEDFSLANGIISTDKGLRYFVDGIVSSGLKSDKTGTYYFGKDGTPQVGWQDVNGKRLYFLDSGRIANGLVQLLSDKYYFKDGEFVLGWQTIDGKKYYFYENGKMATNTELDGYTIGSNGVALKSGCTPENLNNYLDDLLKRYGKSASNIYDAVHDNMTYKWAPEGSSNEEMACYAINNGKGACYHYAALGYCLYKRAGYEVIIISGINGRTGNEHKWLYVKTSEGWIYVDPVYSNGRKMSEQFLLDLGCKWDRSSLPKN